MAKKTGPRADDSQAASEKPTSTRSVRTTDRASGDGVVKQSDGPTRVASQRPAVAVPAGHFRIEIGLEHAKIEDLDERDQRTAGRAGPPIDAIAVGHYLNAKPWATELALDAAISRALPGRVSDRPRVLTDSDLLLTQFALRGIIRGELGQLVFLPDPREAKPPASRATEQDRLIVIAGMGMPGCFGAPELAVLARELCWSLGRLGKLHLATVLIGAGRGNIAIPDAVGAWIRGLVRAVTGSRDDKHRHLSRVTFVDSDPNHMELLDKAISDEVRRINHEIERDHTEWLRGKPDQEGSFRLEVAYTCLDKQEKQKFREISYHQALHSLEQKRKEPRSEEAQSDQLVPTRMFITVEGKTFRIGAMTADASVPEREIAIDPDLVRESNDELVVELDQSRVQGDDFTRAIKSALEIQVERGRLLEHLLLPRDLRPHLATRAPLVLMLDATTARIHWEVVTSPNLVSEPRQRPELTPSEQDEGEQLGGTFDFDENTFLGTARGLTRQLRTVFAPPPEPPPSLRRTLQVLVIANPADDAIPPLPNALKEGEEVASLFEAFNDVYRSSGNRVKVVRLFGPDQATRTNVLRHLLDRHFDVLHFTGHCAYDPGQPELSGWLFHAGKRLSARELNCIDRIPRFVFSNACLSGATPDRSVEQCVGLAPSFAEAFFARGVANFICTGYYVDDVAARAFALELYAGLIGIRRRFAGKAKDEKPTYEQFDPKPMHEAMLGARLALARTPEGIKTWWAYQHYGNPYFQFFEPDTLRPQATKPSPE